MKMSYDKNVVKACLLDYMSGDSVDRISVRHGIPARTISRWINAAGIKGRRGKIKKGTADVKRKTSKIRR